MDIDDRFVTKRKQSKLNISSSPLESAPSSTSHGSIHSLSTIRANNLERSFMINPPIESLTISHRATPAGRRTMSSKAKLIFPVSRLKRYLREDRFATKISPKSCVYLAAVLEYLTAEILDISSEVATQHKKRRINPRYLTLGIKSDEEINRLLPKMTIKEGGVVPYILPEISRNSKKPNNNENITTNEE